MREQLKALVGQQVVVVFGAERRALVGDLARRHGGQGGRYIILTGKRGRPVTVKPSEVVFVAALPTEDEQESSNVRTLAVSA